MEGSQENNNPQNADYQRQNPADSTLLGKYVQTSAKTDKGRESRYLRARFDRYRFQHAAHSMLTIEGKKKFDKGEIDHALNIHQTAKCLRVRYKKAVGVHKSVEHKRAFYSGLIVCGNVFTCPVCAAKVQERRRIEIAKLFDAAYAGQLGANKKVVMLTLTFSHSRDDKLIDLLELQAAALKVLRESTNWRKMKKLYGCVGFLRSLEVTYGINGWHPHTHEALIVDAETCIEKLRELILEKWVEACQRFGLIGDSIEDFKDRSIFMTDNCSTSSYLAKQDDSRHWGVDRELAKSITKHGKKSGRHPFSFLKDYADGNKKAAALYLEYVFGIKGRNGKGRAQIYWQPGLKKKIGIEDKNDKELASEDRDSADLLATLNIADWNIILKHKLRSQVLDVAEQFGAEGIKNYLDTIRKSGATHPLKE